MPAPFYNLIKGTTAGTPGTGAFTPNAASAGFLAWSTVPTNWIGLVRFEDGTAWELQYSFWNGTTLSRSATAQFVSSSTGSALTLTSAATAAMIVDASAVMSHLGTTAWRGWVSVINTVTPSTLGTFTQSDVGTKAAANIATTNYLTEQARVQYTSVTTANGQAGWAYAGNPVAIISTTAGRGGFEMVARWGASTLPTGPKLMVGLTSVTWAAQTTEPSAHVATLCTFAKDSTDTNIQFLTNDGTTGGTKIDTGIAWVAGGWYESSVWMEPGGGRAYGLLIRLDTGAIWYGSTTTDIPNSAQGLLMHVLGGLSGTTGTACVMQIQSTFIRSGP